jgi:hypothetical protein
VRNSLENIGKKYKYYNNHQKIKLRQLKSTECKLNIKKILLPVNGKWH